MSPVASGGIAGSTMAGIGLTVLAYFVFSSHDAVIKWLVTATTVWQILFIRSAIILALCMAIGRGQLLARALATPLKTALVLRGVVLLAAWLCYYTAARDLQLAELTTLYFAAPILVVVLAIPLLGERVTAWRWAGVAIGFVGVVVAANPVGLGLSLPTLLVLAAALLWAFALVLVRRIALREATLVQMLYGNGFFLVATGLVLAFVWRTPDWAELGLMLAVGLLGALGQFTLIEGMRRAPASVLASFEYTALLWAFLLGFAVWGDVPRLAVFAGAALILAGGLLVVVTERRAARLLSAPAKSDAAVA